MNTLTEKELMELRRIRTWLPSKVKDLCIEYNWFNAGDNDTYLKMLDFVRDNKPIKSNLYKVASTIARNTDEPVDVIDIMTALVNRTILTTFERDE